MVGCGLLPPKLAEITYGAHWTCRLRPLARPKFSTPGTGADVTRALGAGWNGLPSVIIPPGTSAFIDRLIRLRNPADVAAIKRHGASLHLPEDVALTGLDDADRLTLFERRDNLGSRSLRRPGEVHPAQSSWAFRDRLQSP